MSKKLYLNKSDSIAAAIDKVINAPDEEVVLYIPRSADVAASIKNIELLKREVEASGKSLIVESVDEDILERVASAGIRANNPFLGRNKHTVSDIVVVKPKRRSAPAEREKHETKKSSKTAKVRVGGLRPPSPRRGFKKVAWGVGLIAVVTIAATLTAVSMPRVSIALTLEKIEQGYIGALRVSPEIEENSADDEMVRLRGVFSSKKKNITKDYPATGTDEVGRKAKGTITIYNAFGTEPQNLVKTTRFETPEGKIYRLDSDVIVPGATKDGEILVPGYTEVSVTADQPGEEFNIGPVEKFTIPGFQGSAKFEGFYGKSGEAMTGGATGQVNAPTDEDIEKARLDAEKSLEEVLKAEMFVEMPEGVQILEGAYELFVTREQVNDVVDNEGQFSITLYGEMKLIGFDEKELLNTLGKRFSEKAGKELMNHSADIDYGEVTVDFENQVLDSAINLTSEWTEPFSVEEFKQRIAGMTENQVKETVFSTPGVTRGEVRMKPFWVRRVPQDLDRISVDAD